jgi:hypothetical protein
MNLLNYFKAFYQVVHELLQQQKFNRSFLSSYLFDLEKKYQGKFSDEQRFKIEKYYGKLIAPILCGTYKMLYGEKITENERKRATLFGILTPLGDDLFDVYHLPIEKITQLTFEPANYEATLFAEKVVKEIQGFLLKSVPNRTEYIAASKDVLDLQVATAAQIDSKIPYELLEEITFRKGAVSVIIYHQILNEAANQQMIVIINEVGGLYQLGNDLFDVYKDTRDGIYTIPNTCKDFSALRDLFLNKVKKMNQLISALSYERDQKEKFSIIINSINARSLVAIDEWIKFYEKHGTDVNLKSFERKALIIDMEKPAMFLKWLYLTWKLPRIK